MARKLRADDPIRLPDGGVMTVRQAVERGVAQVRRAWRLWQDQTHGNILGLSPQWRCCGQLYTSEPDEALRAVYGRGFAFREILLLQATDGSADWGEVNRRATGRLAAFAAHADLAVELDYSDGRLRLTLGAFLAANQDGDGEIDGAARAVIGGEPFAAGGGAEPAWTLRPLARGA